MSTRTLNVQCLTGEERGRILVRVGTTDGKTMFSSDGRAAFTAPHVIARDDIEIVAIADWYDAIAARSATATRGAPNTRDER